MLKQTLLAFTVLGFAGTAAAADITNPFFLPKALHVNSITSGSFTKATYKGDGWADRGYIKQAAEQLQFGILNNLAVIGGIEKYWSKSKGGFKYHNDLDWDAGLAWNIVDCNAKVQLSSVYGQEAPGRTKGTYKYFDTALKLGYQFKTFMPYVSLNVVTPVAQTSRDNRWNYTGRVGVYQGKCEVWSLDTGLAMNFDRADHSHDFTADAEASYYLTKNVTLGVYGSYLLDRQEKFDGDEHNHEKTVGARLRMYF